MDTTLLMLSLLFGSLGFGFFLYGKNTGRMVPLGAGAGLMVLPYALPTVTSMLVVCGIVSALPYFLRDL